MRLRTSQLQSPQLLFWDYLAIKRLSTCYSPVLPMPRARKTAEETVDHELTEISESAKELDERATTKGEPE